MAFRIVHQPNSHVHSIDQQYADDLSKVEIKCLCILDHEAIGSFICCSLDYCADTFCELECFDPSVRLNSIRLCKEKNIPVHFFEVNRETRLCSIHSLVLIVNRTSQSIINRSAREVITVFVFFWTFGTIFIFLLLVCV